MISKHEWDKLIANIEPFIGKAKYIRKDKERYIRSVKNGCIIFEDYSYLDLQTLNDHTSKTIEDLYNSIEIPVSLNYYLGGGV